MNKKVVIVAGVGMVIGIAEALLYYNLGQSAGGKFTYKIPPPAQFFKTAGIVLLTSMVTAGISVLVESRLDDHNKEAA